MTRQIAKVNIRYDDSIIYTRRPTRQVGVKVVAVSRMRLPAEARLALKHRAPKDQLRYYDPRMSAYNYPQLTINGSTHEIDVNL